ncbi:MAG: hypothetical protein CMK59_05495 [Proteobacteria bacterium]|nr:hypothetical protein [Pseudomonadota bacterium]
MPPRIDITPASWGQLFALIGKLVKYAQGGFTKDEKRELVQDLLALLGVLAHDIGEDLSPNENE